MKMNEGVLEVSKMTEHTIPLKQMQLGRTNCLIDRKWQVSYRDRLGFIQTTVCYSTL